ncbi:MAG: phage protein Gp27 family protein [Candidatus Binataceae bacterium]
MPTKSADEKHDKTAPSKVKAAPKAKPLDEAESFAEQLKAVRLAVAEARVIAEETAGDDDAMQRALARMVQSHLFVIMQKLVVVEANPEDKPPDIHAIARTICALNKQEIEMDRWRVEAGSRVNAGVEAAAARVEEAREAGLSPDAAEKIRSALLEIKL